MNPIISAIVEQVHYVANCHQKELSPEERRDLVGLLRDIAETLERVNHDPGD